MEILNRKNQKKENDGKETSGNYDSGKGHQTNESSDQEYFEKEQVGKQIIMTYLERIDLKN